MNILEELYYGNINPTEKSYERNSEYGKLYEIISDNSDKLNACLKNEEKLIFSQLLDADGDLSDINDKERFIEGFRLGARFMLDTFLINPNSPTKNI